ncbi:MAG TPA: GspH/FimT family pseudopilin [Gammaproteobacteria bacterium]
MTIREQNGFTLAELIATVGIAALLMSIAAPSLNQLTLNTRQITSANALLTDFHLARDLAITNNSRVTVCPSSGGEQCEDVSWEEGRIVFVDRDSDRTVSGDEFVERASTELDALEIDSEQFAASISYRPNGRAMAESVRDNTGQFVLCDSRGGSEARVVIVDMSGRPRVSRTTMLGLTPVC